MSAAESDFDEEQGAVALPESEDSDLLWFYYTWLNIRIVQELTEFNNHLSMPYRVHVVEMEPKTKKMRKNGSHTPLAILNELRPGLQYKIVASNGPPHCPNFLASVEVDGTVFTGSANSKKQAKQCAAEASLLTLCPSLLTPADNIDFSKDIPEKAAVQPLPKKLKQEALVTKALGGQVNPVMALNELIPGLKYDCMSDNSSKFSPFVYQVVVDGTTYQGSGSSKKNAKAAAARSVLLQKFGAECASSVMNASFLHGGFLETGPTSLQPVAANKIVENADYNSPVYSNPFVAYPYPEHNFK